MIEVQIMDFSNLNAVMAIIVAPVPGPTPTPLPIPTEVVELCDRCGSEMRITRTKVHTNKKMFTRDWSCTVCADSRVEHRLIGV